MSIKDWKEIGTTFLSIPMAHQMIGFYTVADATDGILKVMRSYQYYAASAISDKVSKIDWTQQNLLGGYIWHTTGSGKTMTSFKSAQLIAESKDADKVIFLVDRIEFGVQSYQNYNNFASDKLIVQQIEDTSELISRLKSNDPADTLIVTSIQKMSRIKEDDKGKEFDIKKMNSKRIVIIVDEAHRDTFGEMLRTIKNTFPHAVFFGFTGTPILNENQKNMSTTADVFGNELHRYCIGDGINDKNVLGFDPYKVLTYKDRDLRKVVALEKAKAESEQAVFDDPNKQKIYLKYMNDIKMYPEEQADGNTAPGIEDFIPNVQYDCDKHRLAVIDDILENWTTLSANNKFHAILTTSSISEAIKYYRLFKKKNNHNLKITALFDPNTDHEETSIFKADGLKEIIDDYNKMYGQDFSLSTHPSMKKDISARLAHKDPYISIEKSPEKQINLLIVVNQMLTGFDSKWINTLYMDKMLESANIIQAFSRTNRLFGPDKPFGVIRYYRRPHTMEKRIEKALKMYSGDTPYALFVEHLPHNLKKINEIYADIEYLFNQAGIENFMKLPDDKSECGKFAKLFKELNNYLAAAKVQGFRWDKSHYEFEIDNPVDVIITEVIYKVLALRYKELAKEGSGGPGESQPYDIETYLSEIDTAKIDADYMNTRFDKWIKNLNQPNITEEEKKSLEDDLHKSFSILSQEEQKFANILLHDIQQGNIKLEPGRTFRDYVTQYMIEHKNDQISVLTSIFGLDRDRLIDLMNSTDMKLNSYGKFDILKQSVNREKAKMYFENKEKRELSLFQLNIKIDEYLNKFIEEGGFDIETKKS